MSLLGAWLLLVALLATPVVTDTDREGALRYSKVQRLGTLENRDINESSGIMAAAKQGDEELFWTHNDSGDGPFLYLLDRRGAHRGTWKITGASSLDAEDCAAGPGPKPGRRYLYYADIGDNFSIRSNCVVWRVPEPVLPANAARSSRERPLATAQAEPLPFAYPDGAHDCEALLVHPTSGIVYLVTKEREGGSSSVYKFPAPLAPGRKETLVKVADLCLGLSKSESLVTAGDIAPDGRRLILRDHRRLYELTLPERAQTLDEIWKQKPQSFPSPKLRQGEAVCYSLDGRSLYLTSENLPTPLYQVSP
jgi:hypothetical protein